jgi:predicted phage terminase large subunit-like protein
MALSTRDSVRCRDVISSDWYQDLFRPDWQLKGDQNVKNHFENTAGGLRQALSITGKGTGFRGDCVRGDSLIATECGEIPIAKLVDMNPWPRVWSFNHASYQPELRAIEAARKIDNRSVMGIDTGFGRKLYCTHEHKIFIDGKYRPAGETAKGEGIMLDLSELRRGEVEAIEDLLAVFPEADRQIDDRDMQRVRRGIPQRRIQPEEAQGSRTQASVLLAVVLLEILQSRKADHPYVQNVRARRIEGFKILWPGMSPSETHAGEILWALWENIQTAQFKERVLRQGLCWSGAFRQDDGQWQLEFQRRRGERRALPEDPADDNGQRPPPVRGVSGTSGDGFHQGWDENESLRSSHRRESGERHAGKSDYVMQRMSLEPPPFKRTQVQISGKGSDKAHAVYDIQVEGNRNFFAECLLIHNCVTVDDPHNVKEHPSDEELSNTRFWWDKRMSSRLNDPRIGTRVVIQQRVHEDDLSGHVLAKKQGYTHICLPTEFDPDRQCSTKWGEDPREEPGELLSPELFPQSVIDEAKEDLGEYDFAGQHNQQPAPPGGGIIKQHWFRFWYPQGLEQRPKRYATKLKDGTLHWHEQIELPERFDSEFQSWDMSFKDKSKTPKKKTDFVVGQVWSMLQKKRFLRDQVRDRMSFTRAVDAVRQLSAAWQQTELKLIEDAANGPAIVDELESEIGGFELITPAGGKEVRAHSASHTIRAGYVYLPHPDLFPWVKELLHEVCTFPRAKNDDQLDALTQLINFTRASGVSMLQALSR